MGLQGQRESWLVAKGYHQQFEFEFNETFALVVKRITIKFILTLSLTYKWELVQPA